MLCFGFYCCRNCRFLHFGSGIMFSHYLQIFMTVSSIKLPGCGSTPCRTGNRRLPVLASSHTEVFGCCTCWCQRNTKGSKTYLQDPSGIKISDQHLRKGECWFVTTSSMTEGNGVWDKSNWFHGTAESPHCRCAEWSEDLVPQLFLQLHCSPVGLCSIQTREAENSVAIFCPVSLVP